jgi:hypothetical protein
MIFKFHQMLQKETSMRMIFWETLIAMTRAILLFYKMKMETMSIRKVAKSMKKVT